MGDIVNLKRVRKRRDRDARDGKAALNRVVFGRSRSERDLIAADRTRRETQLDGHKRDDDGALLD